MKKLAVMVSGGGSNLQALLDAERRGELGGKIALVISNRADAYALRRAEDAQVETAVLARGDYPSADARDRAILAKLRERSIDGVVLAGYLSIVGPALVTAYPNKIINIHPALIPSFCGMGYYGRRVHESVLAYGAKISGATVHFVDEGADTGPIILQEAVPVLDGDTWETLAARVLEVEHKILPRAVALFCRDRLEVRGRRVAILSDDHQI